MYKLVVCDFDGTLFRSDYTVSQTTIDTVKRFMARGGKFAIATGRLFQAVQPYLPQFGLTEGNVIVYQGAAIYDIATKKPVWSKSIDNALAVEAAKLFEQDDLVGMCFYNDICYASLQNENTDYFAKVVGVTPNYVNMTMSQFLKKEGISPQKLLCIGSEGKLIELTKVGRSLYDSLIFNRSAAMLLEVVSEGTGKGNAVKKLAETLGIRQEETICIGDAENDISMIEYAGLGVAMGNAMPSVKAVCDVVAETNDNDGVAKIIKQYCGETNG